MRTVTFSDAKVAAALSEHFICAWKNIRPSEMFSDKAVTLNQRLSADSLNEGAGATNVCSIFALPDGRIVHAVLGYVQPETLLREIEFARSAAKTAAGEKPEEALKALYEQHLKEVAGKNPRSLLGITLTQLSKSPLPPLEKLLQEKTAGLVR
jgi:hypothetical protein